jgi:hypothetical protein
LHLRRCIAGNEELSLQDSQVLADSSNDRYVDEVLAIHSRHGQIQRRYSGSHAPYMLQEAIVENGLFSSKHGLGFGTRR